MRVTKKVKSCLIINDFMLPEKLSDIKLKNYQKFISIEQPTNEDLVKCLCEINDEQLNRFKSSEVDTIILHLTALLNEQPTFKPTFILNGVEYGFIPNLDDITYGENKDLTSYINDYQTMHKAMAVAYRPIKQKQGKKYLIKDYEGSHVLSETMKDAPLDVVMSMVVFFYNLTNDLLQAIPNYLERVAKQEMKHSNLSVENGEAIQNYTRLLREILEDLTRLQRQDYTLV